jgi:hypothetical protein
MRLASASASAIMLKTEVRMVEEAGSSRYDRYKEEISDDITATVAALGCQPILFVGSGLAKRYMNAPNWDELLTYLADQCSGIDKGLGFYKQSLKTPLKIGEEFARIYQDWAWGAGHNEFPESMFGSNVDAQDYIKFKISESLVALTPPDVESLRDNGYANEIDALRSIKPHAIITTNYDEMLEMIFPDHTPVIGQHILKGPHYAVGEIYKIHGSTSEHESLVFTESDYAEFAKKKKFLSAKLLTFFNEHPLLFIGYSATDPNIRAILSDIDEALPEKGGVIPNVYILEWNPDLTPDSAPARDKVIATEDDRSVRVKLIEASDFNWVFDAFSANPVLNDVNPRVLRALIARSYNLVRHDIPKMTVQANFKMLTDAVDSSDSFAQLFGIANITDYSQASVQYPLSATQITKKLGGTGSYLAVYLLKRIKSEKGYDVKASDNRYHRTERVNTTDFHKYSEELLDLLKKVYAGDAYEVRED